MTKKDNRAALAELLRQESDLQFERFSNADALEIGLQLVTAVQDLGMTATISIVRCGQQLFQHAMEGATLDNVEWIRRKENVVLRFGHSSYYMGMYYRQQGSSFEEHTGLDPAQYAAHGGCFPMRLKGTGLIGTVTVSGMPQAEDHAVVVQVLRGHLHAAPT